MKVIVGLGNPGEKYAGSRHNVGFMLLDALARDLDLGGQWREQDNAAVMTVIKEAEKMILVKPLTYMNESGRAVAPILHWHKIDPRDLLVIHDDIDLPVGMVRIRPKGSSGGHNGIKSVIEHIGTQNFPRMKIGIGRPNADESVIDHVLRSFLPEEEEAIRLAVERLIPAVKCWSAEGIDMAMNRFNPAKKAGRKALREDA